MPRSARLLRITGSAPVVVIRPPQVPGVFSYSNDQWVMVVAANPSWHSDADLHRLLADLEKAGQKYRASRRDRSQSRLALRQTLIRDALQAWTNATADTALRFSRVRAAPAGPLIRYLEAALGPILGADMVGRETLAKAICGARR